MDFSISELIHNRQDEQFELYHQQAVRFLKNIGLIDVKSDKKEIPFSVLRSSKLIVALDFDNKKLDIVPNNLLLKFFPSIFYEFLF